MCKTVTVSSTCKANNCSERCEKRVSLERDVRIPMMEVLSGGKIYPAELLIRSDGSLRVTTA